MILLIDNNDSFTYNVLELMRKVSLEIVVIKGEDLDINSIDNFNAIVISPGASLPSDYPIIRQVLDKYHKTKPILGICLGHQAICEYFGATLQNLGEVFHGVETTINCNPKSVLFAGQNTMKVGRYHSWVATNICEPLSVVASDESGRVMAVEHKYLPIFGIQFHPESYITQGGENIIKNFANAVYK